MQNFTPSIYIFPVFLLFLLGGMTACDKESQNDEYCRLYPMPTELPEATCEGKNTIGCYVDSILFVANYFPNTSSWGSQTYEGGVRAFIENPDDDYIQILSEHPIRPNEIDNRYMRLNITYNFLSDSIQSMRYLYRGNGIDLDIVNNEYGNYSGGLLSAQRS